MDSDVKSACFSEISHKILDNSQKVNINEISNQWSVSLKESSELLAEWASKQAKKEFKKEYLIKGIDKKGSPRITVLSEICMEKISKYFKQHQDILYSLDIISASNPLEILDITESKFITLPLEPHKRDNIDVIVKDEPPPLQQEKAQSVAKIEASPKNSASGPSNSGNKTQNIASLFANTKTKKESSTAKSEKTSPEKKTSSLINGNSSQKTSSKTVENKSAKSIANFFNAKPTQKTTLLAQIVKTNGTTKPPPPVPMEVETIEINSTSQETSQEDKDKKNSRKRSFNESDPEVEKAQEEREDENPPKKTKCDTKKKRMIGSRIMQLVDSSDEDEPEKENSKTAENKEVNGKEESSDQNDATTKIKKRKAKRTVTRQYEDEDGYLRTVKEIEEYSCSDEDENVAIVKSATTVSPKKIKSNTSPVTPKKKPPQKAKTKQGSIMNFFTKK